MQEASREISVNKVKDGHTTKRVDGVVVLFGHVLHDLQNVLGLGRGQPPQRGEKFLGFAGRGELRVEKLLRLDAEIFADEEKSGHRGQRFASISTKSESGRDYTRYLFMTGILLRMEEAVRDSKKTRAVMIGTEIILLNTSVFKP